MNMDCPFRPAIDRLAHPATPRASAWLPAALIVTVLGAATLASALTPDTRDLAMRRPAHGQAL
jgi:hypothetical protein